MSDTRVGMFSTRVYTPGRVSNTRVGVSDTYWGVQIHLEEAPGDVLVFLCGQDDIETVAAVRYIYIYVDIYTLIDFS